MNTASPTPAGATLRPTAFLSMSRRFLNYASWRLAATSLAVSLLVSLSPARVLARDELPSPLRLEDVLAYGRSHRQEIVAARARARAAGERPAIVSALEDPMLMPSIDHLPFMLHGVDASLMVEQSFPLSGVRGHRQRAAEADARRLRAESERVSQDVQLDAARAFLMLRERRAMGSVLDEQVVLARQFVAAASARYSSGTGNQPEVLRAELEVARFEGAIRTTAAEVLAAEAMLNASLGRPADAPVPPLETTPVTNEPRPWSEVRSATLRRRPELEVGRAEISRSQAEIAEMKSMYWPMGMIRTGPAYTMADGWGWMLTVGVSVPLQRGRLNAGVREAEAMAEMARADLAAMSRMAEGEAATARGQVLAARERLLALRDDILPRARQAIDPSVSAYAAGTAPLVSVIDTAQALWSIEAELVSAEFELGLAWVRFQRAQGQFGGGSQR
jgi:cobalt-zinc-cadmium efflux system outer membrane protein